MTGAKDVRHGESCNAAFTAVVLKHHLTEDVLIHTHLDGGKFHLALLRGEIQMRHKVGWQCRIDQRFHLLRDRLAARLTRHLCENDIRKRLEQQREARPFLRPRQVDDFDAVFFALAAGRLGVYQRGELHGVKMPPYPLLLRVVHRRQRSALWAGCALFTVVKVYVNLKVRNVQLDIGYLPFLPDTEEPSAVGKYKFMPYIILL